MKMVGNLTYNNLKKGFLESLKKGDVFKYSSSFDARSVEKICSDKGIVVEYMYPNTEEHKTFGSFCMKVTGFINNTPKEPEVKQDNISLSPKQLDDLLKQMFLKGEEWGVAYSTWFTPSEEKHDIEFKQAKEQIIENFKTNNPDVL
jgi:hypothetical protein